MSKLAPVTTGQPTQGMGTVPDATRAVPRQHPSPLQAQKAEAEEAGVFDIPDGPEPPVGIPDEAFVPVGVAPVPSINPRSAHSAAAATVTAAWLSLSATELEVRKYFKALPVPSGLEMLAKMRHQCDLAAQTLQQRMDEGNTERCSGCGKTLEEARKSQWIMQGSEVDPDTGVPMPYRYCGPQCVRARNREKMLPPELRDQKRFDGEDMGEVR
jgi:hypothetical protein